MNGKGGEAGRPGRSISLELIRLAAVATLAYSLLIVLTFASGKLLSSLGTRRSEAVFAAMLISLLACPSLMIVAWRWRCHDRRSTQLLAALAMIGILSAVLLTSGWLP